MVLYKNLKLIYEKAKFEGSQEAFQLLLNKFVTLISYENTYLLERCVVWKGGNCVLRQNGEDMFLDCGGYGIIVDKNDKITIHT